MGRTHTYIRTTTGHQHAHTLVHKTKNVPRGCGGMKMWRNFETRSPYPSSCWTPQRYMPGWTGQRSGDERNSGSFSAMRKTIT